jgi:hypothetical protein
MVVDVSAVRAVAPEGVRWARSVERRCASDGLVVAYYLVSGASFGLYCIVLE